MTQDANQIKIETLPQISLNAKNLRCPMPVIKLQQAIRGLTEESLIKMACTDPGAEKDVASWCKVNKHTLIETKTTDFGIELTIKANIIRV